MDQRPYSPAFHSNPAQITCPYPRFPVGLMSKSCLQQDLLSPFSIMGIVVLGVCRVSPGFRYKTSVFNLVTDFDTVPYMVYVAER